MGIKYWEGVREMLLDYSESVETDIERIREFNYKLVSLVREYITDEDVIFDVKLILNELTINSALHGNRLDPDKLITVYVHIQDSEIKIVVKDQGCGIDSIKPNKEHNSEFVGGRGLCLVDAVVDKFEAYQNRVICVKYL